MLAAAVAYLALSPVQAPYAVPAKLPDVMMLADQADVKLGGYIGNRVAKNEQNRLLEVDLKPLLDGFHKQPGSHPWIGEHIGKWIHASTLAWANTGDKQLKTKLDEAVKELISCQQPDGYLGTYTPDKRFGLYEGADWDVWTHKYDLIGLLTYHRYTQDKASLATCEKIGDLLINTFGPSRKSILAAGTHMGMASTSVLEPIVLLYRSTGKKKYLDFAEYLVQSWEEKGGPRIISTLQAGKPIDQVGNGKAYEMLSNLVGLCELARATGNKTYLDTAKKGWADVVKHELYITGTASYYEHFHPGDDLPNAMSKNVGETCVTVTWMQLSQQLLRLTGEAQYANEFERSAYNHLAAAQNPDGRSWCYYTSLQGTKPYTSDTCCCLSSGPRGMAIIPETAYMTRQIDGVPYVVVNTFEGAKVKVKMAGKEVRLTQVSTFPQAGRISLAINTSAPTKFGILVRVPKWAQGMTSTVKGKLGDGWLRIPPQIWKAKTIGLSYYMSPQLVIGSGSNFGRYAWTFGPFVLATEKPVAGELVTILPMHGEGFEFQYTYKRGDTKQIAIMHPFSEMGAKGGRYSIWMANPAFPANALSLFDSMNEARSSEGNVGGSICDGDPGSFVVTYDGKPQKDAWFSVSSDRPITASKFVFAHGKTFHDGGWFDASIKKPEFQIQIEPGGRWITIGPVLGYPETTATDAKGLKGGEMFTLQMQRDLRFVSLRVVGIPARGDGPNQAFASCGELQAFL